MKKFIDLHTHTLASDGRDAPAAVVAKAAKFGLSAVAITDHDTLDGLAEAETAGQELGIEVIRGCELSVGSDCGEVHILGLWIPREAKAIENALHQLRFNRSQRNEIIVEKLQALGVDIHYDEVLRATRSSDDKQAFLQKVVQKIKKMARRIKPLPPKQNAVGRPHIATVLLEKGYVSTIKEAFTKYLGDGCPAYEPKKLLEVEEIFALLREAGATISLAHPGLIRCTPQWLDTYVGYLKGLGLYALEVYHSEHDPETTQRLEALAQKHALLMTGGSDYHGSVKPQIHIGCGKGNLRIGVDLLDALKEKRRAAGLPIK